VLVIAYHAGSLAGATSSGALALVAAELKAGVAIFFVISGFLLYLPYARAIRAARPLPGWRDFVNRRAVRILPGYWVALTLLAASGLVGGVFTTNWWRFYGLTQSWDPATFESGLSVAWSLSVEVSFYLLLPAFAWGMGYLARARPSSGTARGQLVAIGVLALGSLALRGLLARSVLLPVGANHIVLASSLPGMFDWFALGLGLAVMRAEWEAGSRLGPAFEALARRPGRCWLAAAVLYLAGVPAQQGEYFTATYGVAAHLAIGLAAALFVLPAALPALANDQGRTVALLSSRQLSWLGSISYGMYLWHVPLLKAIVGAIGQPRGVLAFAELFGLTFTGAVCLGAASWYLVERPAQIWWSSRRRSLDARRLRVKAAEGGA
jgi:peptidoglycan/LPS O-acetylase OafA/YrhL